MLFVQYLTIFCVVIAIVAMIVKALRYANAPDHMRWELYPVPHEKGKAEYGGSYLEELDWWTKTRESDMVNEMKEMAGEILLLKGVYHHNRKVWASSFPFHFGMYLLIGWLGLLFVGSLLEVLGIAVHPEAGILGQIVHYITIPIGYLGFAMAGVGALGLYIWRMTDKSQRRFNAPIDYFNLIVVMGACFVALLAQITSDGSFLYMREYVHATLTLGGAYVPGTLFAIEVVLVSFVIFYIPLTRMSHFVAKYFLYHSVRWNDEPNFKGSKIEKRIVDLLNQKVGWSASHIQTGKTWGEVVTEVENEK